MIKNPESLGAAERRVEAWVFRALIDWLRIFGAVAFGMSFVLM